MGLFDFVKKKGSSVENENYSLRTLKDVKIPPPISDITSASRTFDDRIVTKSGAFDLAYRYDNVPARLFATCPSNGYGLSFTSDGKYLVKYGKRIASVLDRNQMISDFLSRGDIVMVRPGTPSGTDLPLSLAFYKKVEDNELDDKLDLSLIVPIIASESYYSHDELPEKDITSGSFFDEYDNEGFLKSNKLTLYSNGRTICTLSDAQSQRIWDLHTDGYELSHGKIMSVSGDEDSAKFNAKISLTFLK